ncbi:MAG: polysaccharide deacetylase [Rhodospirillales bacterium]|nr:polysaccharide deacetylase [Rhodospirillales bacterium]MDE2200230.1 polysaccharide deacetylase [Rhodospirillales bacterium]MDE2576883.1 polysaccharide deacetylase [Rhodospirillales bacterium]
MADLFVCLTFDHDNTSSTIAREATTPTAISRGDFGIAGARRILALLAERRIPATWFIPGHTIESYPSCVRAVRDAGHEIGHHGWTHRVPASLGREGEEGELVRGIAAIAELTGRAPRGYRSPAWDLSAHSVELLLKHGFIYDSSMMGHDVLPYQARSGDHVTLEEKLVFGPDTALVEMPISWALDDFPHFEYSRSPAGILPGGMNARLVIENWLNEFRYMKKHNEWGVLTYTFHPHIIGRGHRMFMLEHMIERLGAEGARFVTMETAVEEYRRRFPNGLSLRGG